MKKAKGQVLLLFSGCYFLFSLYLILINMVSDIRLRDLYNLIGFFLGGLLVLVGVKWKWKKFKNRKIFIVLLLLPIFLRLGLLLLNYTNIVSDYQFFFCSAQSLSQNKAIDTGYISLFPYLYPYIFILGNVMKVLGDGYATVLFVNMVVDLLGSLGFYHLIKIKKDKQSAEVALLFWLWNPFAILWITKCCPVIAVNTLLIMVMVGFVYVRRATSLKSIILLSIGLGFIMSLANGFRPILIIFVLALILYFLVLLFSKTEKQNNNLISLGIILVTFIVGNQVIDIWIEQKIHYTLPKNSGGWSIYVGSNYQHSGKWNLEDSKHLSTIYTQYGNVEAHEILQREGIKRYKDLKEKSLLLWIKKSRVLATGVTTYTYFDVLDSIQISISEEVLSFIRIYLSTFFYSLLFLNFKMSVQCLKRKEEIENGLYPYGIFALGLFTSTLLVEVHARYFLPIMVVLMVFIMIEKKKSSINKIVE